MDNFNPFSLKGKTILITGASDGIGKAIAIACSKMGATLIITGRNEKKLRDTFLQLEGENHTYLALNLINDNDRETLSNINYKLNGIVHCAGIGDRTLTKDIEKSDIERIMQINFEAPMLLQKSLIKNKKIAPSSSIVFIASRAPFAPSIGNGLYAASKGAIIAYSKVLGLELSSRKIRVNCICPAMVWTKLIEKDEIDLGVNYKEKEKEYPLGRFGQPEDIAYLSIYLLSDASSWITGSCFDATGGGEFTLK